VPVCDRLVNDNSKWVRNAAQQQLGPFISSLPAVKVTPGLLAHYIRMGLSPEGALASPLHNMGSLGSVATPGGGAGGPPGGNFFAGAISMGSPPAGAPAGANSGFASAGFAGGGAAPGGGGGAISSVSTRLGTEPSDSDLAAYCAFSFPAVALKLGRARWPELRGLFGALARDAQRKVRKPLAAALHELARILGPDLAEAELLPAFDFFLRDVEEVRVGVVRHVAVLLAALAPSTRESYLPILDEALTGAGRLNWRFRHLLAAQLPLLSQIFSPAATYSVVAPFALRLLSDEVAIVREEAAAGIAPLLNRLAAPDHAALQENLVGRLLKLAGAPSYRDRLQFLRLCGYLGNASTGIAPATFRASFLAPMLALSRDPVRNVRRMLADLLAPLSSAADVLLELRARQAPASAGSGVGAAAVDGGGAASGSGAGDGTGLDSPGAADAAGDAGPVNPRAAAGVEQGAGAAASSAAPAGRAVSRHVTAASGFVPGAGGSGPPSPAHGAGSGVGAAGAAFHHSHNRRPFGFTYDATAIVRGGAVASSPAPLPAAAGAAGAAPPAASTGGAGSSAVAASAAGGSGAPPLSMPGGAGSAAAGPLSVGSVAGAPPLGSVSSSSGGGAATPGPFAVSAALHTHRLRADTADLPEGLDEDMLPQWAWAAAAARADAGASDGPAAAGGAAAAAGGVAATAAGDAAAAGGEGAGTSGSAATGAGAAAAVQAGAADAGSAPAAGSAASTPTKPAAPAGGASAEAPRRAARGSGTSPAPSAAAESAGSAAAASLSISAEVLAALDILAQDDDAETAGRLSPTFLQGHRSKPLLTPRNPTAAGGEGAIAEGAAGSGQLATIVDGGGGLGAVDARSHAGSGAAADADEGDYGVLLTLEDHEVNHASPGAATAAASAPERAADSSPGDGATGNPVGAARDPAAAANDGHPFSFEQQLAALPAADAPQS
jgi:hypothetical protein